MLRKLSCVVHRRRIAGQFALDLLNAGEAGLQFGGQGFQQFVFSNAHRLAFIAQRIFGYHLVLALAQQQADGRIVLWVLDLTIHAVM